MTHEVANGVRLWSGPRSKKGHPHLCSITNAEVFRHDKSIIINAQEPRPDKSAGIQVQFEVSGVELWKLLVTWAPISLHSKVESGVAATPIVTVFCCSVERCFSVPAIPFVVGARSPGQGGPQATSGAGA